MQNLTYRDILRDELLRRCEKNKNYSLRSFAKDLKIEPSQLSRVINGKQNISYNVASYVAKKIFKAKRKQDLFLNLVNYALSKNEEQKLTYLKNIKNLNTKNEQIELQLDSLKVISEWHHIAIMDVLSIENLSQTPKAIASFLGIAEFQASESLKRLLKLGLIENLDGKYKKTNRKLITPVGVSSTCIRKYHTQMIDKAKIALEEQNVSERYVTSKTMSINIKDYKEVSKLIDEFNNKLNHFVDTEGPKNTLYQLNVQFFNLQTKKK